MIVWILIVTIVDLSGPLNNRVEINSTAAAYKTAEDCLAGKEKNLPKFRKKYDDAAMRCIKAELR